LFLLKKVHGLGIRLAINNIAKGLWEKYAYEITTLVCVCLCVGACVRMHACEQQHIHAGRIWYKHVTAQFPAGGKEILSATKHPDQLLQQIYSRKFWLYLDSII